MISFPPSVADHARIHVRLKISSAENTRVPSGTQWSYAREVFLARKFSIVREAHPVGADFAKSARTEKGPGMVGDTQVNWVCSSASFLDLAKVLGALFELQYFAGRSHALAQARLRQRFISSSSHPTHPWAEVWVQRSVRFCPVGVYQQRA